MNTAGGALAAYDDLVEKVAVHARDLAKYYAWLGGTDPQGADDNMSRPLAQQREEIQGMLSSGVVVSSQGEFERVGILGKKFGEENSQTTPERRHDGAATRGCANAQPRQQARERHVASNCQPQGAARPMASLDLQAPKVES